jgi:hypothetical protein
MAVYACINEAGWVGAVTEQPPIDPAAVPDSYILVEMTFAEAESDLLWHTYDAETETFGGLFVPEATTRPVTTGRFYDLFLFAERTAILALTNGVDPIVTDLWARVQLGDPIDLLSPRVATGLAYLASLDVFGVDAAARIAAIIANEDPP